jgi:hypothetical protein
MLTARSAEAGVVAVYPVLDVQDEESTATRAAKTEAVVAHDHVRPESFAAFGVAAR